MDPETIPDENALPVTAAAELPLLQDTIGALETIQEPDRAVQAAKALRVLCERMIGMVCEVDQEFHITQFLRSVSLHVVGPSNFRLVIDDVNCGVDVRQLEEDLVARVNHGDFDKRLRSVQLEDMAHGNTDGQPAEGPVGSPAGEMADGGSRL